MIILLVDLTCLNVHVIIMAHAPGGTHMLRHTGMCRPNGSLFHQKSLDMGPICSKKSLEKGPISRKLRKNCKISRF